MGSRTPRRDKAQLALSGDRVPDHDQLVFDLLLVHIRIVVVEEDGAVIAVGDKEQFARQAARRRGDRFTRPPLQGSAITEAMLPTLAGLPLLIRLSRKSFRWRVAVGQSSERVRNSFGQSAF